MRARCPICRKEFEFPGLERHPEYPFCSSRCRLVDLDRWLEGDYRISTPLAHGDPASGPPPAGPEEPEA